MRTIDIVEKNYPYSNDEIFLSIKEILANTVENDNGDELIPKVANRLLLLAQLMGHITKKSLLKLTISLFNEIEFIKDEVYYSSSLKDSLQSKIYTDADRVKICGTYLAELFQYLILKNNYLQLFNSLPPFQLKISKKVVYSNLDEVEKLLRKKLVSHAVDYANEKSVTEQDSHLKTMIRGLTKIDYLNDSTTFKSDIKYLNTLKENLVPNHIIVTDKAINNKNPHPEIFTGSDCRPFNLFKDYIEELTDPYLDFSFIFQKMKSKSENLIHTHVRHKQFMTWLYDCEFINIKTHDDFNTKETFSTKAERGSRPTRYYLKKEKHFPTDSD